MTRLNAWLMQVAPVIFLLLWSAGFPIAKMGLEYTSPLAFLSIRYALTIIVLAVLFAVLKPGLPQGPKAWRHLAAVGFLIQVMYFGLSYLALQAGVSASVVALIVSLQPVLVGLLAPKFIGERVGGWQWLGLLLGLVGAAGVIIARSRVEVDSISGLVLAIGALLGMPTAMLYEKRFGTKQHPVTSNLVQYSVGFIFCAPLAFFFEHIHVEWTVTFIGLLAYLVVGNSLIAVTLLLAMTRAGKVSSVAALFFFVPPAAAVLSFFILGERLPPLAWVAMAIAVLGVAIATWPARKVAATS